MCPNLGGFLGLITYVGRFIPHLASKTEPLRQLLKQGVPIQWKEIHRNAFNEIKAAGSNAGYLGYFNRDNKTKLIADASPEGVDAVLLQENEDGTTRIIAFASKALSQLEKKYFQTEREGLALVWAVEKFKLYLLGVKFQLITDCKALIFLFSPRSRPCPRIERWVLRLQSYDYEVVHEPGATNLADALSRLSVSDVKPWNDPVEAYIHQLIESTIPEAVTRQNVTEATTSDTVLQKVLKALETDVWDADI